jgi:hypothetical protein
VVEVLERSDVACPAEEADEVLDLRFRDWTPGSFDEVVDVLDAGRRGQRPLVANERIEFAVK